MFGTVLNYVVRHPRRIAIALVRDPARGFERLHERLMQRREDNAEVHVHQPVLDWERQLHALMDIDWPCSEGPAFWQVWRDTVAELEARGISAGPESFAGYNDGDAALVRACWCIVRHTRPEHVIETGVGHGFTSRIILEAMHRNGAGHLFSIDLPPLDPVMRAQIGIAVPASLHNRWELVSGSSRRHLAPLLSRLGTIDLFVHDSLHTERNVTFELECAWRHLRRQGFLVVDDIDSNAGFDAFVRSTAGVGSTLVCEAEPLRPDVRRFNQKGQLGLIQKGPLP
ncbi:MAG TPA: class I SAM-dependent methyltransferase [Rhizomicrobium sp.]|jgi:hypothetical protein